MILAMEEGECAELKAEACELLTIPTADAVAADAANVAVQVGSAAES